ncbi:uncharacterized protein LOC131166167 [Malania oleifera]|uniref:uncharacterized protein LOC131166167 n=1 Tax=Malania oleifera TaxID=397392 RepID=UPI0025AE8115|nr:uncharacterized protein LOC131166167 [Malania oleifera]
MAEPIPETKQEESELVGEGEESHEERENDDCGSSALIPNRAFLLELNLILILSFFSASAEDRGLDLNEKIRKESGKDEGTKTKPLLARLQTRKREVNKFRCAGQRSPRFQPAMRDCRHCRRT